jgi:hypothetical protein
MKRKVGLPGWIRRIGGGSRTSVGSCTARTRCWPIRLSCWCCQKSWRDLPTGRGRMTRWKTVIPPLRDTEHATPRNIASTPRRESASPFPAVSTATSAPQDGPRPRAHPARPRILAEQPASRPRSPSRDMQAITAGAETSGRPPQVSTLLSDAPGSLVSSMI